MHVVTDESSYIFITGTYLVITVSVVCLDPLPPPVLSDAVVVATAWSYLIEPVFELLDLARVVA